MLLGAAVPRAQPDISVALHVGFAAFAAPPRPLPSWRDPGLPVYRGASGDRCGDVL